MSSLGKIFLYAATVLLLGALAAPQAWNLIHSLPPDMFGGYVASLQGMPFHRYLSRSLQVTALLLLVPLLRSLRIRSLAEFGILPNPAAPGDFVTGLVAGTGAAMILHGLPLVLGSSDWKPSGGLLIVPKFLGTALLVALLEEFLFRGVILGYLRQSLGPRSALMISSILFAGVHFLNVTRAEGHDPGWSAGLAAMASLGSSFPPVIPFAWAFCTLFVAGIVLGWMTLKTSSLWAPVALHAAWIFTQQFFNASASAPSWSLPLEGVSQCHGMVPIGILPVGALLVSGLLASLLLKRHRIAG